MDYRGRDMNKSHLRGLFSSSLFFINCKEMDVFFGEEEKKKKEKANRRFIDEKSRGEKEERERTQEITQEMNTTRSKTNTGTEARADRRFWVQLVL